MKYVIIKKKGDFTPIFFNNTPRTMRLTMTNTTKLATEAEKFLVYYRRCDECPTRNFPAKDNHALPRNRKEILEFRGHVPAIKTNIAKR